MGACTTKDPPEVEPDARPETKPPLDTGATKQTSKGTDPIPRPASQTNSQLPNDAAQPGSQKPSYSTHSIETRNVSSANDAHEVQSSIMESKSLDVSKPKVIDNDNRNESALESNENTLIINQEQPVIDVDLKKLPSGEPTALLAELRETKTAVDLEGQPDVGAQEGPSADKSSSEPSRSLPTSSGLAIHPGGVALVLLDPQMDFLEKGGAMPLPGFQESCEKIAQMIESHIPKIHQIIVSLHMRQYNHIAHPGFWIDSSGAHPAPFTIITREEVEQGSWKPCVGATHDEAEARDYCVHYVRQLELQRRMVLCIWPAHCIVGTLGAQIVPCVAAALDKWAQYHHAAPHFIFKGSSVLSEQHSLFREEVETEVKTHDMVSGLLRAADQVLLCGGSMSHAVNLTVRDMMSEWSSGLGERARIALLTDLSPPVPGFELVRNELLEDAANAGLFLTTLDDLPLD